MAAKTTSTDREARVGLRHAQCRGPGVLVRNAEFAVETAAGYSGTPLPKKLGIKPEHVVSVVNPPDHLDELLVPLPDGVTVRRSARGRADVSLVFVRTVGELHRRIDQLWRLAFPDRSVWVCWPKKSSPLFRDLTEDGIREAVLGDGLVDVKVCALDHDWSGLKLMVRKELRS